MPTGRRKADKFSSTIRHFQSRLNHGRVAGLYLPYLVFAVLGISWIALSDQLLLKLPAVRDVVHLTGFQTVKGIVFVVITAVAFFYLHLHNKQRLLASSHTLDNFGTIARASYDLIWRCDASGKNYTLLHTTDYQKYREIIDRGSDCVHPDDLQDDLALLFARGVKPQGPLKTTARLRIEGQYRFFETWVFPIFDAKGKLIELFGTCRDVHDFVVAEESLRGSEEMLRLAAEAGGVGVWDWDIPENVLEVSAETRRQYAADIHSPTELRRYIHPDDYAEIRGAMLNAKQRCEPFDVQYRILTADNQLRWIRNKGAALGEGRNRMVGISQDVTPLKQAEGRLRQLAFFDQLTGLENRQSGQEFLTKLLRDIDLSRNVVGVCLIDIDYFSALNETYGPDLADRILLDTADRLKTVCGHHDLLCRYGPDVFLLVFSMPSIEGFGSKCAKVESLLADTREIGDSQVYVSLSAAFAQTPYHGQSATELLRAAQSALYRAKNNSRGRLVHFAPSMLDLSLRFEAIRNALKTAVANREFSVYYQPLYHIGEQTLSGFEALVRWESESLGKIGPDEFIPIAERIGLIEEIDNLVLGDIAQQIQRWKTRKYQFSCVGFNLSPRSLEMPESANRFHEKVSRLGIRPSELVLEVTETAMIHDAVMVARNIERLSALGYALSIDDFGTGFSSLENLFRFTFRKIKIDKSFVQSITSNERHAKLVKSVVTMAHDQHMQVVAEGVETQEQLSLLRHWGCDMLQGYLFARPVPAREAENYLRWRCVV